MRVCEAATEGTGLAHAVDDESQAIINHIALKIARRAHKLHGRRRNTDDWIFTARGLRARHPVMNSAAARAQLDDAVHQRLKAAGYSFAMCTTEAPEYTHIQNGEDETCTCACCTFYCCAFTVNHWLRNTPVRNLGM